MVLAFLLAVSLWASILTQGALPPAVRQVLDARYRGWRFATLEARLQRGLPAGLSAAWVSGDFDANGQQDYAVQLVRSAVPADSQQQVIAVFGKAGKYQPVLVQAGAVSEVIYLARQPKGSRVVDLAFSDDVDSTSAGDSVVVLPRDGFDILFAEEAALTCYYVVPRFRCIVSGD